MEIIIKGARRQYLILRSWEEAEKQVEQLEEKSVELLDISELENGKVRLYF